MRSFALCALLLGAGLGCSKSKTLVPDSCESSADCRGGEICRDMACREACSADDPCEGALATCAGALGYCVECVDDGDCADSEHCDATRNVCVESECSEDTDCAGGERCDDGICAPLEDECMSASECPRGQLCVDGMCVPSGSECEGDSDCAGGERCASGECIAIMAGCEDDDDCPGGFRCSGDECVPIEPVDAGPPDSGLPDAGPICDPERCDGDDNDCDGLVDEEPNRLCSTGLVCASGACSCPSGSLCGGVCRDLTSNPLHCGGCNNACEIGEGCSQGMCCRLREETVDLLLQVDSSNSMIEEQERLVSQLPELLRGLTSGDVDGDGRLEHPPVSDLHVGVITPDMGTAGNIVPTCDNPSFGEDGILRTRGNQSLAGCQRTYPSFITFGMSADELAADVGCVAAVGQDGCGFEQQLDSALKALTPSTSPLRFHLGTSGHADGANMGFLRSSSVLALVLLTDEDDCSAQEGELFDIMSPRYTGDLNLRCFMHPEALYPIQRYVDGLIALRPGGQRLVYTVVGGVPEDLATENASVPVDWQGILDDPRMQERRDPAEPIRLAPACGAVGTDRFGFPARRIVRVAQGIEARGGTASVGSICSTDLSSTFDGVLQALSRELLYECR